jgi:hypothetical protein
MTPRTLVRTATASSTTMRSPSPANGDGLQGRRRSVSTPDGAHGPLVSLGSAGRGLMARRGGTPPGPAVPQMIIRRREGLGGTATLSDSDHLALKLMAEAPPKNEKGLDAPKLSLDRLASEEVARQLVLIDSEIFNAIRYTELLKQAWSKKDKDRLAANVLRFTARFNEVSAWVVASIVTEKKLETRAKILKKMIQIAHISIELRSFNMATAIQAGISSNSVFRLKKTHDALGPNVQLLKKEVEDQLTPKGNHKRPRELLEQSRGKACIPFLGIFLTDLTFIDDGNENFFEGQRQRLSPLTSMADPSSP